MAASVSSLSSSSSVLLSRPEVVLQRAAHALQLIGHRLLAAVDLVAEQAFRRGYLRRRHQRLQRLVAGGVELLHLLHPRQPLGQVGPQVVEAVELARQAGELVVDRGQLALLDGSHGDRHLGLATGVVTGDELRGERRRGTGRHAFDGVVEARQQLVAPHLVRQVAGGPARHLLPVHGGGEVELHEVAPLGRPVDRLQGREALLKALHLLVDVLVGDLHRIHRDHDRAEVGQRDLGPHVDLGGELQRLAVGEVGDLHLGPAERAYLVLAHGRHDLLRDRPWTASVRIVCRPTRWSMTAAGTLPLRKPGMRDLRADLAVGPLQARLELGERHLDREPHPGRAQGLDGALHGRTPRL
jgi:hypothetical protein